MTHWKDVLCLLAILVAYGIAGHFDREHEAAMALSLGEAMAPACRAPAGTAAAHAPQLLPAPMKAPASASGPACEQVRP
jgi:hypothetical protein